MTRYYEQGGDVIDSATMRVGLYGDPERAAEVAASLNHGYRHESQVHWKRADRPRFVQARAFIVDTLHAVYAECSKDVTAEALTARLNDGEISVTDVNGWEQL